MTDITTHQASRRRLLIALSITCTFMLIQLAGAYYSNSLAVLADAGHLFVHNSSLFIALIASSVAVHLAKNYSDGYKKAELTGGLVNGLLYLAISIVILYEGSQRLEHHHDGQGEAINTYLMSVIAAVGFLFHGLSAWVLYKGRKQSINVYAVFLHSFFDLLSTVSTFVASLLIYLTGFEVIDIASSMLISLFVLFTGIKVVRSCLKGLLIKEVNLPSSEEIERHILITDHVESVHSVTISNIDNQVAVGAHIVLKHHCTIDAHDQACREQVEHILNTEFGIYECVLQIESHNCPEH